jgi:hypothetical protein
MINYSISINEMNIYLSLRQGSLYIVKAHDLFRRCSILDMIVFIGFSYFTKNLSFLL